VGGKLQKQFQVRRYEFTRKKLEKSRKLESDESRFAGGDEQREGVNQVGSESESSFELVDRVLLHVL
jgi:hypothetical protein